MKAKTSTANEIKKYDTEELINFLLEEDLKLEKKDLEIIHEQKVRGSDFLKTSKKEFLSYGLLSGPAKRLAKFAKELDKTIEVYCTASYGNKRISSFQWIVTRETVTLVDLKKKLFKHFKFPDGTEYNHLVISRVIGSGLKRKNFGCQNNSFAESDVTKSDDLEIEIEVRRTICISTDQDLESIICTSSSKVDLEIIVDTCKLLFVNSRQFIKYLQYRISRFTVLQLNYHFHHILSQK
jgi:hypothetical protein